MRSLAVGYDDAQQRFIVRNWGGPAWGMNGYFTIPYAYLTDDNLADDFLDRPHDELREQRPVSISLRRGIARRRLQQAWIAFPRVGA